MAALTSSGVLALGMGMMTICQDRKGVREVGEAAEGVSE
jgi:hypothetical protein